MVSSNSDIRIQDARQVARIYTVGSRAVVAFDWSPAEQSRPWFESMRPAPLSLDDGFSLDDGNAPREKFA